MEDRISFAKVLLDSVESNHDIAKEMCIVKYFNELMAFYNLVALNGSDHRDGIQRYWFENTNKFCMKIRFSTNKKLRVFCNELDKYNGSVFIYGLYYQLTYIPEDTVCTLILECDGCPSPYENM